MQDPVMSDGKTMPLGDGDIAALADTLLEDRRYLDASALYAQLAARDRTRTDLLAKAHYARGMYLLSQDARTEPRLELRRAVELDPNLAEAETELDEIHTIRLPRMGD